MSLSRRSLRILAGVFVLYALLTATHEGEFWPFSIYPMFSQAGNPWTRAVVREVPTDDPAAIDWTAASLDRMPGEAFPLERYGIFQNDLANYVSKSTSWDEAHLKGVRAMFEGHFPDEGGLLVMRVRGALTEGAAGDSVAITAEPFLFISADTSLASPQVRAL